jgi:amino acid adenylation domain-containing protein
MNRSSAEKLAADVPEPTAEAETKEFALTRRQTLFWIDEQLFPDVPYHHIVLRVSLSGALDLERFRRAYADTLASFDQFRLTFATHGGEPFQRFAPQLNVSLPLVDLSDGETQLDARRREQKLESWTVARAQTRFDFARALFDAALLKLGADEHVFYFCQHHVISDGMSAGFFVDDLAKRYRGLSVPERPPYAHYLQSEQAYRESPRAQRDQAYFEKRLGGGMPQLSLYGRTREDKSFGSDRSELRLGVARSEQLAQLVRDTRIELIDPAMSRLVALATLVFAFVYRVGGARTLVLATPVPNRSAEFVHTGGLLMEQTFLRVDIDDNESFCTLANKVRRELFGSLRHAKHSVSDRGLAYVTLNLLRVPKPDFAELAARVELTPLSSFPRDLAAGGGDLRDTFGVHVIGFNEHEPLAIGFDFHRATFDGGLRERAKGHFLALCDAMLADLDTPLTAVELTEASERAHILALGRGVAPLKPALDALLQIAGIAEARSGYPAIRSLGKTLSYGELVSEVGRLAARLAQLGIGRGTRVAFCTPRGVDEPLSMLAAWAVGAAYVPLDASHPSERLRMILEDATPRVLITHSELLERLRVPAGVDVLLLDQERAAIRSLEPLPWVAPEDPEDPAYVLFTSGSTGRPKGVEIPRRAIASFLRSMAHTPGLGPEDRLLAITTTTFDISALELLLPLCVGALVQIADRETVLDPYLLRETLERDGISVLQATPTTWRLLLEAGFGRRRSALKMLCGGEAISRDLADKLLQAGGELWNMYGPTETTVWSTICRLTRNAEPISIGAPIDDTHVYVLGPGGALEPLGVTGELCIGGVGLARGYLNRPDLTAERFIESAHASAADVGPRPDTRASTIIYRTGDLARYLPSGELQCLGRVDHQVKIRGFRIELEEIEACLRRAPNVHEVVVHAIKAGDEPRLVAYYVADGAREDALRKAAQHSLPSYMQPVAYVKLAALPLNTNGKIDKKALPEPALEKSAPHQAHKFENAMELRMAALFQEVLGGVNVPPDRDFFMLGGDSVRAMQLRRHIHETFQVELPLSALFDAPTVRSLVRALRSQNVRPTPLFLQLRPGLRDAPPLICVMGIALYRDLALALDTDRAVYGVHVPLGLRSGVHAPSVEEIAQRYTELILERVPHGPYHLAGLCFGGLVGFEVAHQLLRRGHEVRTLAVFDGLLPRGVRYSARAHVQALVDKPERIVSRLRERAEKLAQRFKQPAPLGAEGELDLVLQGSEAARLASGYDARAQPLPVPFMLFRATEREEAPWYRVDARLGWGDLGAPVTVHSVPGTHLSILQAANVKSIAEVLSKSLAQEPPLGRHSRPPPSAL